MIIRASLLALPLTCCCLSAAAEQSAPPPAPKTDCTSPTHRQFDFWVGDWNVTVGGKRAGENRIEKILKGCALLENWTGAGGLSGKSLNFYDRDRGVWHQTWIDDTGGSLLLDGKFADGKMVLTGSRTDPATQKTMTSRITWSVLPSGEVRQVWETSTDGKTWMVAFDGLYTKKG